MDRLMLDQSSSSGVSQQHALNRPQGIIIWDANVWGKVGEQVQDFIETSAAGIRLGFR